MVGRARRLGLGGALEIPAPRRARGRSAGAPGRRRPGRRAGLGPFARRSALRRRPPVARLPARPRLARPRKGTGIRGCRLRRRRPAPRSLVASVDALPEGQWVHVDRLSDWLERTRPALVREQLTARGLLASRAARMVAVDLRCSATCCSVRCTGSGASPRCRRHARRPPPCATARVRAMHLGRPRPGRAVARRPRYAARGGALFDPSRAGPRFALRAAPVSRRGEPVERRLHRRLSTPACAFDACAAPARVEDRLRGWQERFGAVSVRPAVLVEARTQPESTRPLPTSASAAWSARGSVRRPRRSPPPTRSSSPPSFGSRPPAPGRRRAASVVGPAAGVRQPGGPAGAGVPAGEPAGIPARAPEHLAELEGSATLLERLELQFPPERLRELRAAAARLGGELQARVPVRKTRRRRTR